MVAFGCVETRCLFPLTNPNFSPIFGDSKSLVQAWQVSKMFVVERFSVCKCAAWKSKGQYYVSYSNLIFFTHFNSLSTVILRFGLSRAYPLSPHCNI